MRLCGPLATVAVTTQHVFRPFVRASLATTASVRPTSIADPSCYGLTLFRDVLYSDPVYPSCSGGFPLQPPQGAGARSGYTLPEERRPRPACVGLLIPPAPDETHRGRTRMVGTNARAPLKAPLSAP